MFNNGNCNLFRNDGTTLTMFESISTHADGFLTGLQFDVVKPECFHLDTVVKGFDRLLEVTGVQENGQPTTIYAASLEVYRLYLNEDL
jgi:hypothetical protein